MLKSCLLFFFLCLISCKSQQQEIADIEKLIAISEKSEFSPFCRLVHSLGYLILDSSRESDGSLFYFAKEPKFKGRTLACSADKSDKIKQLSLVTFDKNEYRQLQSKLRELGFTSSGFNKESQRDILASEDFERKGLYIATAIREKEGEPHIYEFTFFKW